MQRDFLHPQGYAARAGMDIEPLRAAIHPVSQVLAAARTADLAVVHTREGHLPDLSDCPPYKLERSRRAGAEIGSNGPMGRLLVRGEHGHDFIDALQPRPGEVVIDKPGYSVSSTLRAAVDRGYRCFTVADACASADAQLHEAALRMIAVEGGIFGEVTSVAHVCNALAEQNS